MTEKAPGPQFSAEEIISYYRMIKAMGQQNLLDYQVFNRAVILKDDARHGQLSEQEMQEIQELGLKMVFLLITATSNATGVLSMQLLAVLGKKNIANLFK